MIDIAMYKIAMKRRKFYSYVWNQQNLKLLIYTKIKRIRKVENLIITKNISISSSIVWSIWFYWIKLPSKS